MLITHDLGVVAELCQRTLVMYGGQLMESGPTESLLAQPGHPYTVGLLDSRPTLDSPLDVPLAAIPGAPPDLSRLPPGCPFEPRCPRAFEPCAAQRPPPLPRAAAVIRACHAG